MGKLLPLLKIEEGTLPPDVLVCGDPERAKLISGLMENGRELAVNREYHTYTGTYRGVPLVVCSHGVGAAGAAVCFEELIMGGARRIVRVGTAGSLQREIVDGDLVVATAAVREDGMTEQLVPQSYPAVADGAVTAALVGAAGNQDRGVSFHAGVVLTVGAFYPGVMELPNNLMSHAGVLAVEMECSVLFVIAGLRKIQAGAVLAIDGLAIDFDGADYNPHRDAVKRGVTAGAQVALEALVAMRKGD